MRCRRVRRLRGVFSEGLLAPRDREAVLAHMAECAACAGAVERAVRLRRLLRSSGELYLDPAEEAQLLQRIRAATRTLRVGGRRRPRPVAVWERVARSLWRPVLLGTAAATILVTLSFYHATDQPDRRELALTSATDELMFYLEEHALSENQLIFNQGTMTGYLLAEGLSR